VSARDEIALVHKKNGSYRRRGAANTKRRGVGIGDGVLQAKESRRCTRFLASPLLSTPERPWPMPNGFGSAGSRQNNLRVRRNDLSLHTMMWSKHSRRMKPISRSTVESTPHSRGAAQVRDRGSTIDRGQISSPPAEATFPDLANFLDQSHGADGLYRPGRHDERPGDGGSD